jgi:hypothetical protein
MPFPRRWTVAGVCALIMLSGLAAPAGASVSVTLMWTAPGDDGREGSVRTYEIRYSTTPLTQANFHLATRLSNPPPPRAAGLRQIAVVSGLTEGLTYYFAIKAVDEAGNFSPISNVAYFTSGLVDVGSPGRTLVFSAPYPNPARSQTRFRIQLPKPGPVRIEVFDVRGRRVRTLVDAWASGAPTEVVWDLRDGSGGAAPAGIYMVRAQLGDHTLSRTALVVR